MAGVSAAVDVPPGASGAGLLAATLFVPDARLPEPDAAAEQPARARLAAIPSVQLAATRADLLCDRTCMLPEVVSADVLDTGT